MMKAWNAISTTLGEEPGAQPPDRAPDGLRIPPDGVGDDDGPPQAERAAQALGALRVGRARHDLDPDEAPAFRVLEKARDLEARHPELVRDVELPRVLEVIATQHGLDDGVGRVGEGHRLASIPIRSHERIDIPVCLDSSILWPLT